MLTLIIYQIKSDSLRRKIRRLLLNFGYSVQNSVFEFRLTKTQRISLINSLKQFEQLLGKQDSIRVYSVCQSCLKRSFVIGKKTITTDPLFYLV